MKMLAILILVTALFVGAANAAALAANVHPWLGVGVLLAFVAGGFRWAAQ